VPQKQHDEAPSSSRDWRSGSLGQDTTSRPGVAQDEGARVIPLASDWKHEIVANAGRDREGRAVFLAREESSPAAPTRLSSEGVIALLAYSPQSNAAALGGIPMLNRAAIAPPRCRSA
jgi:hypothetical protein